MKCKTLWIKYQINYSTQYKILLRQGNLYGRIRIIWKNPNQLFRKER
jgi:hypothetical protein